MMGTRLPSSSQTKKHSLARQDRIPPAREVLGPEAGDAIAVAARAARIHL